jgi:uncharacterized protein (TIGR02300 family)
LSKPEWGLKRICPSCGTRYYDMRHDPIVCPKCGATFDAEAVVKTKRVRAPSPTETALGPIAAEELDTELVAGIENEEVHDTLPIKAGEPAPEVEAETETETEEESSDAEAEGEAEAEEQEVLEDASELGEDEDDMAEVIENVDEEEER